MQSLRIYHVPVLALLLLSIVSCSSKSDSDQDNGGAVEDNSLLYVGDPAFLADPANLGDQVTLGDPFSLSDPFTLGDPVSLADPATLNDATDATSTDVYTGNRDIATQTFSAGTGNEQSDSDLLLNSSNYEQVAKSAVQAINMVELNTELVNARELLFELNASGWRVLAGESALPGLTFASQEDIPSEFGRGDFAQTFTCEEGGMLTVRLTDFNDGPFYHYRASFDSCNWNGQIHNGELEASGARRAPDLTVFNNYMRTTSGRSVLITGEHEHVFPFFGSPESLSWRDTDIVVTNNTGTIEISDVNWSEEGLDAAYAESIQGFALLPDGTVMYVVQIDHVASLKANFNFIPTQSEAKSEGLTIEVDLGFKNRYFDWQGHYLTGFELPTFPVTELGAILEVHSEFDIFSGTSRFFDSLPKDLTPQWQDGDIRITAPDSSSLVMRPDPKNDDAMLIELNDSGEQIPRFWSEGFQVNCPVAVGVCG